LERHIAYRGIEPRKLLAVLLTHEHGDHALSVAAFARRHGVPVVCNGPTRAALGAELDGLVVEELPIGERATIGPFDLRSFTLAHDAAAPVGYRISAEGATAAMAVDLGSWDGSVVNALMGADLVVIEANHDRERLMVAPYPWQVRQRIYGPLGHLDNVQAGEILARVCAQRSDCDVWLAHLSEQSNSPKLATQGVQRVLQMAGVAFPRIQALPRRTRPELRDAPVWHSDALGAVQGSLFPL
jgi:phosphoribosyl 1,2-cyclic phosphodiesterase